MENEFKFINQKEIQKLLHISDKTCTRLSIFFENVPKVLNRST